LPDISLLLFKCVNQSLVDAWVEQGWRGQLPNMNDHDRCPEAGGEVRNLTEALSTRR
jgi:hypothetical protein